ncbi:toll/interleukin-1 receptor domain-containing protein [Pigmentiphaga sp.]|uniref:toll/interleukin-1 receptor domain-containing protein n=1 Tax=Pigmentiphaga sp. TaxID=1977564 RepID=UPI0025D26A52|nr:toll/interleukin-1 receptor domain-containing protein [Pigmentiphaga sp.]
MPDTQPVVFISYKHADYSTRVARKLCDALEVVSDALGIRVFLDDEINPSEEWKATVNATMGEMTHFIALLTNEYLLKRSTECRRELLTAVQRYEDGGKTRLLFVLVDDISPGLISLSADRKAGKLVSDEPRVEKLGDINFLGPYNDAKQLVRLEWENDGRLSDQIKQLIDRFQRTLPKRGG